MFVNNVYSGSYNLPIYLYLQEKDNGNIKKIDLKLELKKYMKPTHELVIKGVYGDFANRKDYAVFFAVDEYKDNQLEDLKKPDFRCK